VQIEIDRSLYMDEARIQPNAEFNDFRRRLAGVIAQIARLGQSGQELAAQ
jgi:N-formylglutamate deformylase